jgi:hypothetical protein
MQASVKGRMGEKPNRVDKGNILNLYEGSNEREKGEDSR